MKEKHATSQKRKKEEEARSLFLKIKRHAHLQRMLGGD